MRNFGWVGPFLVIGALSLGSVYLVRRAPVRPRLYLVLYSLTLDFNRGDVPTTSYALLMLLLGYQIGAWLGAVRPQGAARTVPARAA